ncbi:hypothetical protein [Aquiflexum sp.]|uniref:hypothetical protein n=1 Tax=Aquiflexum sp. TaxID=1872584 RepID=UPI003593B629
MNNTEIDEIIIKGLKESEMRNEIFVNQAKPRVWDAIGKPKNRKTVNWWFVSAMAAAISFFFVSTFLFLKLESQKKELIALKTFVSNEISSKGSTFEMVLPLEKPIIDKKPSAIQESILIAKSEKTISQIRNPEREMDEGIETSEPIFSESNLTLMIVPNLEIGIPEMFLQEMNPLVVQIPELIEETKPKSKKQAKLRLKFGYGSKDHDYQNTYALNIKL